VVEPEADRAQWTLWLLVDGPVAKRDSWTRFVNRVETEAELKSVRHSRERGTPFGDEAWQQATAEQLGLESSLPRGRPRLDRR
jgi:putative transposase